jgi:hypothetical protein
MGKRGTTVKEETREKVIELAKNYSESYIAQHLNLSMSEIYKILRQEKNRPLHFADLSVTASKLASNFDTYLKNNEPEGIPIGDVVYSGKLDDYDDMLTPRMKDTNKSVASNLLCHLKMEFPELTSINDWAQLRDDKITHDFITRLTLKANRGDFKGKCPACPR